MIYDTEEFLKNETMYDRINKKLYFKRATRKDLSEAIGVSYNTLTTMFQRKSTNVDIETIRKIAKFLDVTIEYLVTGVDHSFDDAHAIFDALKEYQIAINLGDSGYITTLKKEQIEILDEIINSFSAVNKTETMVNDYKKNHKLTEVSEKIINNLITHEKLEKAAIEIREGKLK